jgi:hypothetical protein
MSQAMPQQVPSPLLYSATTSDVLALARRARAQCLHGWMLAGWQKRPALRAAVIARLAGYVGAFRALLSMSSRS